MQKIKLYWNHICILHNQEKKFLEKAKENLKQFDIDLEITYFGLGYEYSMSKYLEKDDAVLPDIIVSADLEVFEFDHVFSKLKNDLYELCNDETIHNSQNTKGIIRDSKLLPFVGIPLVYFTTEPEKVENKHVFEINDISIGGVDNSAIKTVVKSIWERYGKEKVTDMLESALIAPMPIVAFSNVKKGNAKTALVPAIYSMRADEETEFMRIPKEGPLVIPSFICARNSVPYDKILEVLKNITTEEICDFYIDNGNLITFSGNASKQNEYQTGEYFSPTNKFFSEVSSEEFYKLYEKCIPHAYIPNSLNNC